MAEWRVPIEHLLEFAGEEERQHYLSPERTEAERGETRTELEEVYQSISDPSDMELKQSIGARAWAETQHNPSARDLARAQWKGFRKADARAELERHKAASRPPEQPRSEAPKSEPEPSKPELPQAPNIYDVFNALAKSDYVKFWTPRPDQQEAQKAAADLHPPEPPVDEGFVRIASAEDVKRMQGMAETFAKDRRDQERLAKLKSEVPEWVDRPDTIHLSLEDEGVAEASFGPPEDPLYDNPLPQHPITPETRKKIEAQGKWGDDWPSKDKDQQVNEIDSLWEKLWKFTESNLFWGGGVGVALAAYAFLFGGAPRWFPLLLLVASWLIISLSVYRHRFFEGRPSLAQVVANAIVYALVGFVLIIFWLLLVPTHAPSTIADSHVPVEQPSPLDSRLTVVPSSSPKASPSQKATPSLERPRIERLEALNGIKVTGGKANRLNILMSEAGYRGTTWMDVLIVKSIESNAIEIVIGTWSGATLGKLDGGDYYNFPGGEDTRSVFIFSKKDATIDITYRQHPKQP